MPFRIVRYEETPNPSALKCWLDRPISDRPRSFLSAESARDDALAAALFAGAPITTLLFNGDWLTVNKTPRARWRHVKPAIEAILARA